MTAKANLFWPGWTTRTPEERKGAEEPRAQFLAGRKQVEGWIDEEKGRLLKQKIRGSFPAVGTLKGYAQTGTMEFSRYNEPFNIVAPSQEEFLPAAS